VEEDGCSGEALLSYDYKDFMGKSIQLVCLKRAMKEFQADGRRTSSGESQGALPFLDSRLKRPP